MGLRALLRIARWEVTKNAGGVDRRTVLIAIGAMGLLGLVVPTIAGGTVGLDQGIYRVGIAEESPYYPVASGDSTFAVRPPDRAALETGGVDVLVTGSTRGETAIRFANDEKGRAAYAEFRSAIERFNDRKLDREPNETAAFPVVVSLEYREQTGRGSTYRIDGDDPEVAGAGDGGSDGAGGSESESGGTDGSSGDGTDGTDGSSGDGTDGTDGSSGDGTDGTDGSSGDGTDGTDGSSGDGTDGTDGSSGDGTGGTDGSSGGDDSSGETGDGAGETGSESGATDDRTATDGGGALGSLGAGLAGGETETRSPSELAPPFPFQSLVLAFVFIIPLNFLIQAYGSTILSERINRRGELMLVSPVSRFDIIGGKTLPYFLGAMAVESAIAVGLSFVSQGSLGGLISIAAVAPLVLLFLSATFLGAMFARSFKELTFVTVTITVTLTSYAFVPAIFADIGAVALISPLTLVVRDLQNQAISLLEFTFSTLPPLLTAFVLFGLGAGLYREEDMFAQRPIPLKVLDALAGRIHRAWHVGLLTALLLPFVFVLELLSIAMLFALGELSIPLVLVAVAVIEEVGKSLHVYASYAHRRFDRRLRTALVLGVFSGVGFFLAEKITVLAQLVGLPEIQTGQAALQTGLIEGPDPFLLLGLSLLFPLVLHVVTASISAVGASRGRRAYAVALGVAILVHLAYNYTVFQVVSGLA